MAAEKELEKEHIGVKVWDDLDPVHIRVKPKREPEIWTPPSELTPGIGELETYIALSVARNALRERIRPLDRSQESETLPGIDQLIGPSESPGALTQSPGFLDAFYEQFTRNRMIESEPADQYVTALYLLGDIELYKLAEHLPEVIPRTVKVTLNAEELKEETYQMSYEMYRRCKEARVFEADFLGSRHAKSIKLITDLLEGTDASKWANAWGGAKLFVDQRVAPDMLSFIATKDAEPYKDNVYVKELMALAAKSRPKAQTEYYNQFDDSFDYRYHDIDGIHSARAHSHSLQFDGHNHYRHNQQLISGEHNDLSGSPLLIGGIVGASSIVIIMLIFCLGLAFGMVIYWGFAQKRALKMKRKKEEMRWMDDEDRNEVIIS
eukprot:135249_1